MKDGSEVQHLTELEAAQPSEAALTSEERTALLLRAAEEKSAENSEARIDTSEARQTAVETRIRALNETERSRIQSEVGPYLRETNTEESYAKGDRARVELASFSAEAEAYFGSVPRSEAVKSAFTGQVEITTLQPGDKIYRIFDAECNVDGRWWSRSPPPETEEEWRNRDAVLSSWNGNGAYVEYTIPEGESLEVLIGPTAQQPVELNRHYDAVGEQIYMRGGSGCMDHPDNIRYFHSKWAKTR